MRLHSESARIVVIGNAGGGKSTLARKLAARRGVPYIEVDAFTWKPGWVLAPEAEYRAAHAQAIAGESWVLDGLGRLDSMAERFARATEIVFVDMPMWVHCWLAAERQIAWAKGKLAHPLAGISEMVSTRGMFESLFETERDWMPEIRRLVAEAEACGTPVRRIASYEDLQAYGNELGTELM